MKLLIYSNKHIMEQKIKTNETYYESIIRQGYNRRDFLKFVAFIGEEEMKTGMLKPKNMKTGQQEII